MLYQDEAGQVKEAILKNLSPEEKWAEVLKLRQLAWDMKKAAIKMQHPEFLEVLERENISYLVTGSVAAIFYGEPRLTHVL